MTKVSYLNNSQRSPSKTNDKVEERERWETKMNIRLSL